MNKKQYELKKRIIERKLEEQKMKKELRKLKWSWLPKFKRPTTSKLILFAVLLLNIQIIWFVEKVIMHYGDLSSLYALIAVPATLIPTVWAYYSKSKAQNSVGGITYDLAMEELKHKYETPINNNTETYEDIENDNSVG